MTLKMKIALKRITKKLLAMSKEEFKAEMKKHEYGDISRMLMYAWDPEMKSDYWKDAPPVTEYERKEG
jgi:hypothetical protein